MVMIYIYCDKDQSNEQVIASSETDSEVVSVHTCTYAGATAYVQHPMDVPAVRL